MQQYILDQVTELLKIELDDSLIGAYLHGSMAMGCYHPLQSDIDILVIIREKRSIESYKRIAKELIKLEDKMNLSKGFELSIVEEGYAANFTYPTPFEFHYSASHKERYRLDETYFCGGYEDRDLAAHFVLTYHRGIVLYGKEIKEVIAPIDPHYYISSILSDLEDAQTGVLDNPVYYVLNLSRVLLFLREAIIASKKEGGEWALKHVPLEYEDIIIQCLAKYSNEIDALQLNNHSLMNYTAYMLNEIESARKKIKDGVAPE